MKDQNLERDEAERIITELVDLEEQEKALQEKIKKELAQKSQLLTTEQQKNQ